MFLIRAQRLLNSIEAGITNSASLETLLADPGRYTDLAVFLNTPFNAQRVILGKSSRNAIFGSALACKAFFSSSIAINVLTEHSPALTDFKNNSSVINNILTDSTTTENLLSNEKLLSELKSSIPAMNTLAASSVARNAIGVGLGTPTVAYNVLKTSHVAVAKMMAGHAGLNPTLFNTTRDLWNGTAAGVFTPLTNSKDAIRFGLYSSLAGFLKAASGSSTLIVDSNAPFQLQPNSEASLYFLRLAFSGSSSEQFYLQGPNVLPGEWLNIATTDTTMNSLANTTFSKVVNAAESNPTALMKAGRARSTIYLNNNPTGYIGIIGIGTE